MGATPVIIEHLLDKTEFKITPDQLRAATAMSRTRMFVAEFAERTRFGSVFIRARKSRRWEIFAWRSGILVTSDEIYAEVTFMTAWEHVSVAAFSQAHYDHTIIVHGFAKAYSMTGLA